MSNLIYLLKSLSEQGLGDIISKKKENQSFNEYIFESIKEENKNSSKNVMVYTRLLYLYGGEGYKYFWSNNGVYSPDIIDEVINTRDFLKNHSISGDFLSSKFYENFKSSEDYLKISKFVSEKQKEDLTFQKLVEKANINWLTRHERLDNVLEIAENYIGHSVEEISKYNSPKKDDIKHQGSFEKRRGCIDKELQDFSEYIKEFFLNIYKKYDIEKVKDFQKKLIIYTHSLTKDKRYEQSIIFSLTRPLTENNNLTINYEEYKNIIQNVN